jgi:hypothetical protein
MGWKVLNNFLEYLFWFGLVVFIVYACSGNLPLTDKKCEDTKETSK